MNINECRSEKANLKTLAENIVNSAIASKQDLAGAQLDQYNALVASIKRIDAAMDEHAAGSTARTTQTRPNFMAVEPVADGRKGLTSNLRAIFAKSTREQREQIEGIAAYLTGRDISAAADMKPSGAGGFIIPSFVVPALERDYTAFAPVVSVARLWATEDVLPLNYSRISQPTICALSGRLISATT